VYPFPSVTEASYDPWRHRFAILLALATVGLIFVGGLVTSTGSGLSVPDWPLSYGRVNPPMVGGVRYEHGHRLVASAVGFLTLVLALWTARREARPGVRRLAWIALAAVIVQGVLGGLTVKFLLPVAISVLHACLAQGFLCLTIALAYVLSREGVLEAGSGADVAGVRKAASATAGMMFLQLLLGALMRHTGAGMAIPDFPLSFGKVAPPFWNGPIAIHYAHRVGALIVVAKLLRLALKAHRSGDGRLKMPAFAVAMLGLAQVGLGAATVLTGKAVLPTTAHVATGGAILGLTFLVLLRARHLYRTPVVALAAASSPALVEA
jgi:heme a synthase